MAHRKRQSKAHAQIVLVRLVRCGVLLCFCGHSCHWHAVIIIVIVVIIITATCHPHPLVVGVTVYCCL